MTERRCQSFIQSTNHAFFLPLLTFPVIFPCFWMSAESVWESFDGASSWVLIAVRMSNVDRKNTKRSSQQIVSSRKSVSRFISCKRIFFFFFTSFFFYCDAPFLRSYFELITKIAPRVTWINAGIARYLNLSCSFLHVHREMLESAIRDQPGKTRKF